MRAIPKTAKIHPAAKNVVAGKNLPYARSEYYMYGWASTIVLMAIKTDVKKEVKLKSQ